MRLFLWVFILLSLAIGAGAYLKFQGKNEGRAAETVNVTVPGPASSILVGHWTLDGNDVVWGDTSSEIKDVSGYAKHGNSSNLAAGSAVVGRIGQGLVFNGSSDSVSLGNVYNGVKTVAFWVKPNTTTQSLVDLNATATVDINAGTVRGNNFSTPTVYVDGVATTTFPDTAWHHIAITTATGINASAAYLGKIALSYFGGTLDDIRFYSSELSATQVADLYRASGAKQTINFGMQGTLASGLVGHWTFDGNDVIWGDTGTEVKDVSGSNNHGAVSGLTRSSAVIGKLGQGLSFNGTSNYVSAPLDLSSTPTVTVSFWLKADAWVNDDDSAIEHSNGLIWFFLLPSASSAKCNSGDTYVSIGNNSIAGENFKCYSRPSVGEWHHYLAVWDMTQAAVNEIAFYLDGTLQASHWNFETGNNTGNFSNDILYAMSSDGAGEYLAGKMDDLRIYNRALSASEILNLYNLGR